MSHNVFSNTSQISGKAGANKSIARFPDVCLSPPSPPAGPIPIPYPDTSQSSDLKKGSKTVKVGGKPVTLAQQSHYKPSALGNEAATKSFGASVITHVITGKTVFQSWSMDVKFEGKNVCRHIDLTTSNHNCPPPATPPLPTAEGMNVPGNSEAEDPKCPCCGEDAHPNQVDESGDMYETTTEDEFYGKVVDNRQAKVDSIADDIATGAPYTKDPTKLQFVRDRCDEQLKDAKDAKTKIDTARAEDPPCPNLHTPPDEGCGTHFIMTRSLTSLAPKKKKGKKQYVRKTVLGFNDSVRKACQDGQKMYGTEDPIPKSGQVNHMTPLSAGGCPTSQDNLIPQDSLSPKCQKVDQAQTKLQEFGEEDW